MSDESGMDVLMPNTALYILGDVERAIEDRAAAYSVLYKGQLRINRALRAVRDELILHMERNEMRALGPLRIKATAVGVEWPCNDPDNWGDIAVQDAMRVLSVDRKTSAYVRHIPHHYELDTAALGAGVAEGVPAAIALHREVKAMGWRTEEARRLGLEVK